MRRRNREINIFNISALDLFASAMGAFVIICLLCLPYYLKSETSRDELRELKEKNAQMQQDLDQAQNTVREYREALSKTFLMVIIKWPQDKVDMDLHVIDPAGHEYDYSRHNRKDNASGERTHYPGEDAEISVDVINSAGVEVWETPLAKPGTYRIIYHYYGGSSGANATVSGNVLHKAGSTDLPQKTLRSGQRITVAEVIVDSSGNVSIR